MYRGIKLFQVDDIIKLSLGRTGLYKTLVKKKLCCFLINQYIMTSQPVAVHFAVLVEVGTHGAEGGVVIVTYKVSVSHPPLPVVGVLVPQPLLVLIPDQVPRARPSLFVFIKLYLVRFYFNCL